MLNYEMSISKKGKIILIFQDEKDHSVKPDGAQVVRETVSEPEGSVTLTDTVTIPSGAKELRLFVPLMPEGLRETNGEVTIRYPIEEK